MNALHPTAFGPGKQTKADHKLMDDYRAAFAAVNNGKKVKLDFHPDRRGWFRIKGFQSPAVQHMDLSRAELGRLRDNLRKRIVRA